MTTFGILVLWFGSFAHAISDTTRWRSVSGALMATGTAAIVILRLNGGLS